MNAEPLLAIVGPTASGKSDLGIALDVDCLAGYVSGGIGSRAERAAFAAAAYVASRERSGLCTTCPAS